MNLNLAAAAGAKARKRSQKALDPNRNVGFGLNSRKKTTRRKSVFAESDDDDDAGGRHDALAAEQEAVHQRARSAVAYDFDGAYDAAAATAQQQQRPAVPQKKESRYMTDLLKHAEEREREREIVFERKLAKDQRSEDAKEEYKGKEKFVTGAYRRKLEERKVWEKNEKLKKLREEEDDVAKKGNMAGFYGNFGRNVAVGGKQQQQQAIVEEPTAPGAGVPSKNNETKTARETDVSSWQHQQQQQHGAVKSRWGGKVVAAQPRRKLEPTSAEDLATKQRKEALDRAASRAARSEKIAAARARYFERTNVPLQ